MSKTTTMADGKLNVVTFVPKDGKEFGTTLKKRVSQYFKDKGISRKGDYRMWIKVVVMPLLYMLPLIAIMLNLFQDNLLAFYGLWIMMGIGLAGCGLGIMHDAVHGGLSKNARTNKIVGLILNVIGGYDLNWKIQHNILHHSFTNIDGHDEDIDPGGLLRFSPHAPHKSFFRYQAFYAWFLYGLMTFSWVTFKDFLQLGRYDRKGLLATQGTTYGKEMVKLIINKVLYYAVTVALPIFLLEISWYHIILGWFAMHFLGGLILALVFQPAHVIPDAQYPLPNENNQIENDWLIHQMLTTANFAPKNRILSWYVGGLNYQIEHHLFPQMCHVHHPAVSKIVKETAEEFGLPYYSEKTFLGAIISHTKMLHQLGRAEFEPVSGSAVPA